MLTELPTLTLILWGSATALTLLILGQILARGYSRTLSLFASYLAINLLQTMIFAVMYQWHGIAASTIFTVAWTSQAVVVLARASAVVELTHLALGKYEGIWALAVRILGLGGLLALGLALYFGRNGYHVGILALEIALEASVATWITGLFVFARYYQVQVQPLTALMGLGLGLLSCLRVLNDVVFAHFLKIDAVVWNYVASSVFVAILLVWVAALRKPFSEVSFDRSLTSAEAYASLIPSVNRKLAGLNDQLTQFWRLESPKP